MQDKIPLGLMYCYNLWLSKTLGLRVSDIRLGDGRVYTRTVKNLISGKYVLSRKGKVVISLCIYTDAYIHKYVFIHLYKPTFYNTTLLPINIYL